MLDHPFFRLLAIMSAGEQKLWGDSLDSRSWDEIVAEAAGLDSKVDTDSGI